MFMKELDDLLDFCHRNYQASDASKFKKCGNKCINKQRCGGCAGDCYKCIQWINDFHNNKDHYNCINMTYNYVLKYGYRFFAETCVLFNEVADSWSISDDVYVASIGCGPSTELYGLLSAWRHKNKDEIKLHYRGFDLNPIWRTLIDYNNQYMKIDANSSITDAFAFYKNSEEPLKVLFLNYSLSDMYRFSNKTFDMFVQDLCKLIICRKVSMLLFNDVYTIQSINAFNKLLSILNKIGIVDSHCERCFHQKNDSVGSFGNFVSTTKFPEMNKVIVYHYEPFRALASIQAVIKFKSL